MFRRLLLLCIVCLVLFACDKSTEPKYTIPLPTFSPAAGTYPEIKTVHIDCSVSNATIRYTLDGTDPTTSSPIYNNNSPLTITQAITIKAKAFKAKMKPSAVATARYYFNVADVYITPIGQVCAAPLPLTMTGTTLGTVIRYTLDGTDPTSTSTVYTAPVVIDGNVVVKARGFIEGWTPGNIRTYTYTFNVTQPSLSIATGTYYNSFELTMNTPSTGAAIHYTTDGTDPLETSYLYTAPIEISSTETIKAKAFKANWNPSGIVSADYTMKVTASNFSPVPSTYNKPQEVTITTPTPETKIYYTTDGSTPSITPSLLYSTPIPINEITTLKAMAVRPGWTTSNITAGSYNFKVLAPVMNPGSGQYAGAQNVTISCATPGAEIRYTTNGSDPNLSSTLYTNPIPITAAGSSTLKAAAFKTNWLQSSMTTGLYLITNTVANPTFDPPGATYFEPQTVVLSCSTPLAEIRYTLDGSEPVYNSTLFYYPIEVSAYTEIKAKGFLNGWTPSQTVSMVYQFDTTEQIVAWGTNNYNQCNVPLGSDFAQIDAGMYHTIGLRTDGSLVAWGRNNNGQCNFPAGNDYVAIAAGDNHSLALKVDGTIVAWGLNDEGQCDVPDSLGLVYTAISAGAKHSLALTSTNTIVAWGLNDAGQCDVPAGNNFTKISAGANHNLALKETGMIVAWGNNDNGQINAPTGTNYADIAAGDQHSIAKKTDGTLIGWGLNTNGQTTCPSGTGFVKISAGYRHNLALKQDGSIVHWGYSGGGLAQVPTVVAYIDVSAGRDFSIALKPNATTYQRNNLKHLRPKFKLK